MVWVRCQNPKAKWRNGAPCGYGWEYRGSLKSRIRCPKCHSAQNQVNWRKFGHFQPSQEVSRTDRKDAKKAKSA